MDSCPSLVAIRLNNVWASAFLPIGVSILGSRCSLKYDWQINETSLPESSYGDIWTPLLEMLTLGHFATVCCIMSILVCANIPWLDMDHKTSWSSLLFSGTTIGCSLPWSLYKRVLGLLNLIWGHMYLEPYVDLTCSAPLPANSLIWYNYL